MITELHKGETIVGRLRIKGAGVDPTLARLRISSLMSGASFQSGPGRPAAIVIIRKFRDPLPGVLRLDHGGGQVPAVWDKAVREALERLAHNAARPAREAVSPSAEAVVFIDASELLACLAGDWCEGTMMTRWWWQSLLKQGAATQIVKELWRRDPEYVPAALQQLASKNKATDFVRALRGSEARELLRGVAQSFALPALMRVLDSFETPANADQNSVNPERAGTTARGGNDRVSLTAAAPWRPWVPECRTAELPPEQEFFLGVSLMLQRALVKARAPEFQARVQEWQQEISLARAGKSVRTSVAEGQAATPDQRPRDSAILDEQLPHSSVKQPDESARVGPQINEAATSSNLADQKPISVDAAPPAYAVAEPIDLVNADQIVLTPLHPESADAELRPQASQPTELLASLSAALEKTESATTTPTIGLAGDSMGLTIGSQRPAPASDTSAGRTALPIVSGDAALPASEDLPAFQFVETPLQVSATVATESAETEEWIETQFGGVFYLINLGLSLGLYGDFTTPDEPGIQLGIWDFVALLAGELVGDDVVNDPVFPLLQQLAQREEGELLGSGFEEAVLSFEFSVLSSNSGVSSSELSNDPTEKQPREPGNSKLKTENSKLETTPAVAAWLNRLTPYVRTRLRQALGLSEADDPGPLVCRHRARVCLTPTHLDVFFFLVELPIEIRFAGLDRNPGWVPAAGRFIAFHFD